jgi:hypothetical protein
MKLLLTLFLLFTTCVSFSQSTSNYRILSSQQMQSDLDVLKAEWLTLHPGLFRYLTNDQLEQMFIDAKNYCTTEKDEREFYLLLSKMAAKIKCGHTFLSPFNMDDSLRARFLPQTVLPFFYTVIDKKFIVTHNISGNSNIKKGDEIISINGNSVGAIIDSLLLVSRADGNNALGKKLNNIKISPEGSENYNLFDIYFPFFFPSDNNLKYKLEVKVFKSGKISYQNADAVNLKNRKELFESKYGKLVSKEDTWQYKILSDNTAYTKFGTFAMWNTKFDGAKFIDSVFKGLKQKKNIKNLIIDIRGNEGGDDSWELILANITNKEIGCDMPLKRAFKYLTIPDSLKRYLSTWDNSFKKDKNPDDFFTDEFGLYEKKESNEPCETIKPTLNRFSGKVFLLIDAENSSATFQMARLFQSEKLGTSVGETTGGTKQGINGGQFFFLTLPNSGFEIDQPLIYQYSSNQPDEGIKPDYEVKTTQADIYNDFDRQLKFVLDLISKN